MKKKAAPKSDTKGKPKDHSKLNPLFKWIFDSAGITEDNTHGRAKRHAAARPSGSGFRIEKEQTAGEESASVPKSEKETRAQKLKKRSSTKKIYDTFFRRTEEQPWDAFDLLAPWMLTSKGKKVYDQVVKEKNEERVRQGRPKK